MPGNGFAAGAGCAQVAPPVGTVPSGGRPVETAVGVTRQGPAEQEHRAAVAVLGATSAVVGTAMRIDGDLTPGA